MLLRSGNTNFTSIKKYGVRWLWVKVTDFARFRDYADDDDGHMLTRSILVFYYIYIYPSEEKFALFKGSRNAFCLLLVVTY